MSSLKQIRYFLTVADLGNFTHAASRLFVAQPALSRQIALLEKELGFSLFEREARGVKLTPAGVGYRDRVMAIESQLAAAAEEAAQIARGDAGVLRLLHSSSIPANSLMPSIKRFLEEAPKARIDLDRLSSELQVTEVANGKADIGIVRLPVLRRDPGVTFTELAAERLWVALPVGHPLASRQTLMIGDLQEELFVSAVHRERGGLARLVADLCLRRGYLPKLARVITRKSSMLDLVAAGLGIAVIPERMTGMMQEGLVYRALADEDALARSALVLPLHPTALVKRFASIMADTTILPKAT
jgi:DNA-binding transcriptional LysR family regulator